MLLIHVSSALLSLAISTSAVLWSSKRTIYSSAGLMATTLASGTWLVISKHLNILSVCLSGLLYVSFTGACLAAARKRLA